MAFKRKLVNPISLYNVKEDDINVNEIFLRKINEGVKIKKEGER